MFQDVPLRVDFIGDGLGYDKERARQDLLQMAEDIRVDKSYVAFKGTKYKNVFLTEEGWNALLSYIWRAKDRATPVDQVVLRKAFESMIVAYMQHIADVLGYDSAYVEFQVDPESDIRTRLVKDTAREWERYPGPWQDWPQNN